MKTDCFLPKNNPSSSYLAVVNFQGNFKHDPPFLVPCLSDGYHVFQGNHDSVDGLMMSLVQTPIEKSRGFLRSYSLKNAESRNFIFRVLLVVEFGL